MQRADATSSRARRFAGALPALAVIVAALSSVVGQLWLFADPTADEDWERAAEAAIERAGPADRVRVHPSWTEAPLPHLHEITARVDRTDDPVDEDLLAARRVWIVSEAGRVDEAVERLPFEPSETEVHAFDSVSLVEARVPDGALERPYSMFEHIDEARVRHVRLDGDRRETTQPCRTYDRRRRRWHCGKRDKWIWVGPSIRPMDDDQRRCIYAHPPGGDERVSVTFEDVPVGRLLRIRAGLTMRAIRSKRGTNVYMEVRVGDEVLFEHTFVPGTSTWDAHDLSTEALAGRPRDVTVEIWSDEVFERYFCFGGWVIE